MGGKLKTLKDLEIKDENEEDSPNFNNGWNDCLEKLRAEAIKWIKAKAVSFGEDDLMFVSDLREFFNISEGDLENG